MNEPDLSLAERIELEESIELLYLPGHYAEGEDLCLEVLEGLDDFPVATLYLSLNLAAQGFVEEALETADYIPDHLLLEGLQRLPFGSGDQAETELYHRLIELSHERGQGQQVEAFLRGEKKAPEKEPALPPNPWKESHPAKTSFLLDLREQSPLESQDRFHERSFQDEPDTDWIWNLDQ